jgi:hypothetical protein
MRPVYGLLALGVLLILAVSACGPQQPALTSLPSATKVLPVCPTPIGGGPTPVDCSVQVSGCPTPIGGGPTPVDCSVQVSGCPTPIGGGPTPIDCSGQTSTCPTPIGGGPTPVDCSGQVSGCPTPIGGGPTPISCNGPTIQLGINANCHVGPGLDYSPAAVGLVGQSYPIVGISADYLWYYINFDGSLNCWIGKGAGTTSGDLSQLPQGPVSQGSQSACSSYTDKTACLANTTCQWVNSIVRSSYCTNK